jgi:hypothetical protein
MRHSVLCNFATVALDNGGLIGQADSVARNMHRRQQQAVAVVSSSHNTAVPAGDSF